MTEITSKTNDRVVYDSKLTVKSERDERGLYLIEGYKLLFDALKTNQKLERVYIAAEAIDKNADLVAKLEKEKVEVIKTNEQIIAKLTETKTPQGIAAVVKKPKNSVTSNGKSLLLERIQDPKNVGALIRSACGAGFNTVYLIDSADPYSLKSIRASMSGVFFVNLVTTTLKDAFAAIKNKKLIVGDMHGESLKEIKLPKTDLCIAVGNEGNGISEELKSTADIVVSIPMLTNIESLNVAVSGSILMYNTVL